MTLQEENSRYHNGIDNRRVRLCFGLYSERNKVDFLFRTDVPEEAVSKTTLVMMNKLSTLLLLLLNNIFMDFY